jgi:hypothetical protein
MHWRNASGLQSTRRNRDNGHGLQSRIHKVEDAVLKRKIYDRILASPFY